MPKIILALIFIILLPSGRIFAQGLKQDQAWVEKSGNTTEVRSLIIDVVMNKVMLAMNKDKEKDKEDIKAANNEDRPLQEKPRPKEKKQFFFDPISQRLDRSSSSKNLEKSPRFLSIQNTGNALKFRFESEDEKRTLASSSLTTHRSRVLFEEILETDFRGSVYHPNLVSFNVNLENGLKQSKEKFLNRSTGKVRNGYLDQFHIDSSFLRNKPYAFSLFADKARQLESHEFFERQIINSTRYGGNFGYKNIYWPVGFSFSNTSKVIDRDTRPSQTYDDDVLELNLNNESKHFGRTRFEAIQDKFSRSEEGTPGQNGILRNFDLNNQKFFSKDKKRLYSTLRYYDLTGTSKNRLLNLVENFDIDHTDSLSTSYGYNFSDRTFSGIKITENRLDASLRHKLYESLTSTLRTYYFKSDATSTSQDVYGLSWDEDYIKKLGRIGTINFGLGLSYADEKRISPSGIISVADELHVLALGSIVFLDTPRVDTSTVVVTDTTGTTTYILNTDYQLTAVGERTQIQRIPGGSIAEGQQVKVTYQASTNPSAHFNTLVENFRFRMSFLDDMLGVFYRLVKETHPSVSSDEDVILQKLTDSIFGIDFKYKNLILEMENEDYDSSLSPYKRLLFRESFYFNPSQSSTLTFQLSQSVVRLVSTGETQKFFDYITRYGIGLGRYSRLNIEGGFRLQRGRGIDLNDFIAGADYELNFGKFQMDARYDFKRQIFIGDKLINHFFYLTAKRMF